MSTTRAPLWSAATDAEEIVQRARRAHVAVRTSGGPHTTPVAVAWSGGTLWFVTPRRSVKARAARRGAISALLRVDGRGLVLGGGAVVLDPLRPGTAAPRTLLRVLPATMRYLRTQAGETVSITRDALTGLLRELDLAPLAPRAVIGLVPHRAAVLPEEMAAADVADWAGGEAWGAPLPRLDVARVSRPPGDWARCLPKALGAVLRTDGPAVLTVDSSAGPLPLPGEWQWRTGTVRLSPSAAALLPRGAARAPCCVTILARDEPGLRGKAGVLLRGVASTVDDRRAPRLSVARVNWWDGTTTGTVLPRDLEEVRRRHVR